MKKYKHIKTGDIVSKIDNDIIRFYTSNKFGIIHAEIVENSNDWQEITKPECKCGVFDECDKSLGCKRNLHKPEYTILSFKYKKLFPKETEFRIINNKDKDFEGCLNNEEFDSGNSYSDYVEIYSVRRESDGEIFTIGDKYNWKSNKNRTNIIRQILLEDNKILIHDSEYISEEYDADLDQIEKVKQPLFTTEDGVDIYKGNTYYYINTGFIGETQEVKNAICPIMKGAYTFSTKQAAEEYIIMNKPCLSYSDLERLIGAKGTLLRIEELVKQKLKQ